MKSVFSYNSRHILSSVLMILTLAWLTVSLPVVTSHQQASLAEKTKAKENKEKKDTGNPFSNTTEEKNPGTNTIAEEFLHESCFHTEHLPLPVNYNKCTHPAVYVAFHGELLSPPPETC